MRLQQAFACPAPGWACGRRPPEGARDDGGTEAAGGDTGWRRWLGSNAERRRRRHGPREGGGLRRRVRELAAPEGAPTVAEPRRPATSAGERPATWKRRCRAAAPEEQPVGRRELAGTRDAGGEDGARGEEGGRRGRRKGARRRWMDKEERRGKKKRG